uniref:Uncharacterized protein n=1 Tax=Vitis vinifera TaxID=29760 RepID=F6I5B2_VITVI
MAKLHSRGHHQWMTILSGQKHYHLIRNSHHHASRF